MKQQEPLADERSEVEMHSYRNLAGRGLFSLLEVALIASVLAVVATIVGPRISHAAAPAASHDEQLLEGRLRMLRGAIEEYWFDHGGQFPSGNAVRITEQLTTYTDFDGNPSRRPDRQHSLGPYLREIPLLPVGENRGQSRLSLQFEDGAGWVYQPATGRIRANTATWEVDSNFR